MSSAKQQCTATQNAKGKRGRSPQHATDGPGFSPQQRRHANARPEPSRGARTPPVRGAAAAGDAANLTAAAALADALGEAASSNATLALATKNPR